MAGGRLTIGSRQCSAVRPTALFTSAQPSRDRLAAVRQRDRPVESARSSASQRSLTHPRSGRFSRINVLMASTPTIASTLSPTAINTSSEPRVERSRRRARCLYSSAQARRLTHRPVCKTAQTPRLRGVTMRYEYRYLGSVPHGGAGVVPRDGADADPRRLRTAPGHTSTCRCDERTGIRFAEHAGRNRSDERHNDRRAPEGRRRPHATYRAPLTTASAARQTSVVRVDPQPSTLVRKIGNPSMSAYLGR